MNLDKIYPIGALYLSMRDTEPSALFGGEWARVKGRTLVGVDEADGDFVAAGLTGGAKSVALAVAQMGAHAHAFTTTNVTASTNGAHTHQLRAVGGSFGNSGYAAGTQNAGAFANTVAHSHGSYTPAGTLGDTGSGAAHNNLQPYLTCYIWYRVA